MRDTFFVRFEKKAIVYGRDASWAEYRWNQSESYWYSIDGQRSESFFHLNPEFTPMMPDDKMTFYSIK